MTRLARTRNDRTILDGVVLATATASLVLLLLPLAWGMGESLPIVKLAGSLALFSSAYWVASVLLDQTENRIVVRFGVPTMQVGTALALSWGWHLAGGVSNLACLWMFAPFLLVSALLWPGWCPYVVTVASWISVVGIALSESDSLRLTLFWMGFPTGYWSESLSRERNAPIVPGTSQSPSQILSALLLFFGGSLMIVLLGDFLSRRVGRTVTLASEFEPDRGERSLFQQVIERDRIPRAIVQARSGTIVHMSAGFRNQMLVDSEPANFLEVIRFADPAIPQHLLTSEETEVEHCRYQVRGEVRVGRIRARRILVDSEPMACVSFEEVLTGLNASPGAAGLESAGA